MYLVVLVWIKSERFLINHIYCEVAIVFWCPEIRLYDQAIFYIQYAPVINKQSNSDILNLPTNSNFKTIYRSVRWSLLSGFTTGAEHLEELDINLLFATFLHYLMIFLFISSFDHSFKKRLISFFDRLSLLNSFQLQVWTFSVNYLINGFYNQFKTLHITEFYYGDHKCSLSGIPDRRRLIQLFDQYWWFTVAFAPW